MIGKVKILDPGLYSTIQDKGRFEYGSFGVPRSGAMDTTSYNLANALLNNNENDAVLEWTLKPPTLKFFNPTLISLTGADVDAYVNNLKVEMNSQIPIKENDVLSFSFCRNQVYGYVGICAGFLAPILLSSRSFYKNITPIHRLEKGTVLEYEMYDKFEKQFSFLKVKNNFESDNIIEVSKGPEFDLLIDEQKTILFGENFSVSKNINRMAIQLEGELQNDLPSILTSPVLPGTVQLTPSGKLIVLMRDCQTTGGYPRILQLTEQSVNKITQKRTGDQIRFEL